MATLAVNPDGSDRHRVDQLPRQAALAGWPTPAAEEPEQFLARKEKAKANGAQLGVSLTSLSLVSTMAGWPTPTKEDGKSSRRHGYHEDGRERAAVNPVKETLTGHPGTTLTDAANMAGWPTPRAAQQGPDYAIKDRPEKGGYSLETTTQMAGWPTPQGRDGAEGRSGMEERTGGRQRNLDDYVTLAGWPTAVDSFRSRSGDGIGEMGLDQMVRTMVEAPSGPARLTVIGELLTGSSAGMESGGQLNPEHSRWLQGLPAAWGSCGAMAIQSMPRSRKRSSKA
jgi:hypothetical protein